MKDVSITCILLSLLAEIIGTVGGFGSSVFFVPIANFYFDFHSVLGLTAIFHLFSNISKIMLFRKGLDKRLLLYIGVPSILFVVLGGVLSNYFRSFYLEVILGVFLLAFSFALFNQAAARSYAVQSKRNCWRSSFWLFCWIIRYRRSNSWINYGGIQS